MTRLSGSGGKGEREKSSRRGSDTDGREAGVMGETGGPSMEPGNSDGASPHNELTPERSDNDC
jgi:hypothetical protein